MPKNAKKSRVICYIDGFNLYHSIDDLGRPHLKWLDLWALSETMIWPHEQLVSVKYFSAYAKWLPDPYRRHLKYVAALETAGVEPIMSHFKKKDRYCKRCGNTWKAHEEKETDVRIALAVMEDGYDDIYDRALIVSGDSDLVPVIEKARARFVDKTYYVAAPPGQWPFSRDIRGTGHGSFELSPTRLADCLFDENVTNSDGNVIASRPVEYQPPAVQ